MIYSKTALGQSALQDRSITLSPKQRAVFIMVDGKKAGEELLKATAGMGVTAADLQHLITLGFVQAQALAMQAEAKPKPPASPSSQAAALDTAKSSQNNAQACYARAYPIATRLTAALGLRGFRLNLAVEAANDFDKLNALSPKIKEAVGDKKAKELEDALAGLF